MVEECKAEDKNHAPGRPLALEKQHQQQQQQSQQQRQQQRETPQDAAQEAAVAATMVRLCLNEVGGASTPTIATASASAATTDGDRNQQLPAPTSASAPPCKEEVEGEASEEDLEEEKHDFFFEGAADGMKCSIGFCLMTEAVVAMDGFSCKKSSLEEYIAHCAVKGQALTSPLTKERMGETYMPNHNLRNVVKDYIGERKKWWRIHVAQRRAGRKGK